MDRGSSKLVFSKDRIRCVPVVPEFLLCEAVQVGNVWPRLRVQVPLLAVGRAAGYAGQCTSVTGDIPYIAVHQAFSNG